jgi:hypothetical protein
MNKEKRYRLKMWTILKSLYPNCPICNKPNDKNSQFAHIKETGLNGMGRGKPQRLFNILHNLDSYRYMHEECHTYYDNVLKDD